MEKGAPVGVSVLPSLQGIGPQQPSVDRLALLHPAHQLFHHQLQQQRPQTRSPKALVSIAHIRKATRGVVALENCHPFARSWGGQTWVFAHNGDLQGAIPLGDRYRPFGSTDSEAAFCWILEQLDHSGVDSNDAAAVFEQLHHCAAQLAERGTFNALISNGQWLFVTATSRLHWLTRRAPFCKATLADPPPQVDFAALTTSNDVVQCGCHGVRPIPIPASSEPAAAAQTPVR